MSCRLCESSSLHMTRGDRRCAFDSHGVFRGGRHCATLDTLLGLAPFRTVAAGGRMSLVSLSNAGAIVILAWRGPGSEIMFGQHLEMLGADDALAVAPLLLSHCEEVIAAHSPKRGT